MGADIIALRPDPPEPAIHGPRVTGATPGRPFLFLIPATGEGPLRFRAENLPPGLELDADTGIISGTIEQPGATEVQLEVSGPRGTAARTLDIVAEPGRLALTPPMGWNPWNIWARDIDDQKVRDAADWLVASGLAAHGYQYINLDDCWEGTRGPDGVIRSNERFPDMKALADYIHAKGLRFGIYSSPGPETCADYVGSYGHEAQDARTYAEWGVDYLKYDWCSYTGIAKAITKQELQLPFRVMRAALDACGRDIVYSWSQGGFGNVWKWGAEVGGNLWRTTGDIRGAWESMSNIGFSQNAAAPYAQPGHWNDPDMLVVGVTKWGSSKLTPDEQVTHLTLWCLLAAPLFVGCDLSKLDPFTLALLTNDEVLDVDQDRLGRSATRREMQGVWTMAARRLLGSFDAARTLHDAPDVWGEVWARPLYDGTMAAGLFNRGSEAGPITAHWSTLGLAGPQPVRDLWQHQNLGEFDGAFTAIVPAHGAAMIKIGNPDSHRPPAQ
jgi:alpha-galactosidase